MPTCKLHYTIPTLYARVLSKVKSILFAVIDHQPESTTHSRLSAATKLYEHYGRGLPLPEVACMSLQLEAVMICKDWW